MEGNHIPGAKGEGKRKHLSGSHPQYRHLHSRRWEEEKRGSSQPSPSLRLSHVHLTAQRALVEHQCVPRPGLGDGESTTPHHWGCKKQKLTQTILGKSGGSIDLKTPRCHGNWKSMRAPFSLLLSHAGVQICCLAPSLYTDRFLISLHSEFPATQTWQPQALSLMTFQLSTTCQLSLTLGNKCALHF